MVPRPRAILFDMDGVLVKSDETWFRCVEDAGVRFRGRAVTREEFFPTFGQGTVADVNVFGLRCTPAELDAFYVEAFVRHLGTMWINPEAAPLLSALKDAGIARAVVTNTVGQLTHEILTRARLLDFFTSRATSDRVAHAKPAPDLVQLACRELGVEANEAWMVGDSKYDRGAAQAAGVRFVGLGLDGDARIEGLAQLQRLLAL